MADDEPSDNATVQMSAEQLKRLHAELASANAKSTGRPPPEEDADDYPAEAYASSEAEFTDEEPSDGSGDYDAEQAEDVVAAAPAQKPVKQPKPEKAAKPAKAPKPEKAARPAAAPRATAAHESPGGGGLLIVGGIGAIVAGLSVCLPILGQIQGMVGEPWPIIGGTVGMALGHLLVGLGMFGAVSRTNGVAALVGTLHVLAMLGLVFFMLALFRVIELDADMVQYAMLAPAILPGTAWLLSGIWGFAAGAGAMGVLHGVFSLLGGAAMIGLSVGALAGEIGPQDDLGMALGLGGPGAVLLGTIFLAIAMFGTLRRPA